MHLGRDLMNLTEAPKVGDTVHAWFTGDQPDGSNTVMEVRPSTTSDYCTHVVKVRAPNTVRGWMEMSAKVRGMIKC